MPPPLWKNKYMFHARPLMHQIISLITAEANNDAIQDDKTQSAWGCDSAFKNFNKTRAPLKTRSKAYLYTYCGAGFFSKAPLFAPVSNHSYLFDLWFGYKIYSTCRQYATGIDV
jgi:hypothetical protein